MNEKYIKYAAAKLQKSGFTDINFVSSDEMGADILATSKNGAKVCVGCRYSENPITANAIQEVYQAKQHYNCNAAMVMTNSTFTAKAEEYAAKAKVLLKPSIAMPTSPVPSTSANVVNTSHSSLVCPVCGSDDVEMKLMQENQGTTVISKSKTRGTTKSGHGCLWWLCIGWWWWFVDLFIWIFAFVPRLIVQICKGKKTKSKSKTTTVSQEVAHIEYKTMCMCRSCGHHWEKH